MFRVSAQGVNSYHFMGSSPSPAVDTTPPTTPTGLAGSAVSTSQIDLSWNASTDPDSPVAGYKVYRSGTLVASPTSPNYSDTGLTANTAYSYTVSAYDAAGNTSSQTAALSVTTESSSSGSGAFSIGARVKTTSSLNVRNKPNTKGGKILCVQPAGALGTISSGPQSNQGYTWWNVNFDAGCDGWAVQTYLTTSLAMSAPLSASQVAGAATATERLQDLTAQLMSTLLQLQQLIGQVH
jgi:chitodextrinase